MSVSLSILSFMFRCKSARIRVRPPIITYLIFNFTTNSFKSSFLCLTTEKDNLHYRQNEVIRSSLLFYCFLCVLFCFVSLCFVLFFTAENLFFLRAEKCLYMLREWNWGKKPNTHLCQRYSIGNRKSFRDKCFLFFFREFYFPITTSSGKNCLFGILSGESSFKIN